MSAQSAIPFRTECKMKIAQILPSSVIYEKLTGIALIPPGRDAERSNASALHARTSSIPIRKHSESEQASTIWAAKPQNLKT